MTLDVPTPPAFVAMKLLAWSDRQAPRDLFDLHELARQGHFTRDVPEFFHGVTGFRPGPATLGDRVPAGVERSWEAELGHQLDGLPKPSACLEAVRHELMQLTRRG